MFAVVCAGGKTGGAAARRLLAEGLPVRALVRRDDQAEALRRCGVAAVVGEITDPRALAATFAGARAAYVLGPPAYRDADMFARAGAVHAALIAAAAEAGVGRLVALSSVGAQHASGTGNIATTHDLEARLAGSGLAYTLLRAANFIDNWAWALEPVRARGILRSMLLPLDRRIPSVAARDVGEAAARLMVEDGPRGRIVELHGPADYSPQDAARALSARLRQPVRAVGVPEGEWIGAFTRQGMPARSAAAFAEMYRGFNGGRVAFEGTHETWRGRTGLEAALADLLSPARDRVDR